MKLIKRLLLRQLLKGDNVECPICKHRFITFLPFGLKPRANAHCPYCGSLERHRLLWLFLKNKTNFFEVKNKVLHVAPEKFFMKEFKKNLNIEYYAGDKFEGGFDKSYSKDVKYLDITDIKFDDESFDMVFCSHVLEHVPDDIKAMREIHRILKPAGWAILQVPIDEEKDFTYEDNSITDPKEREKAFGQFDHLRLYGKDYKQRLESAGFRVEVVDVYSQFNDLQRFKYGLIRDDIFLCYKY